MSRSGPHARGRTRGNDEGHGCTAHQHGEGTVQRVPLGPRNGLDHDCVVSIDNVITIPASALGRPVGFLMPDQEKQLARAIVVAFDLDVPLES